jgi:hypothetical protein
LGKIYHLLALSSFLSISFKVDVEGNSTNIYKIKYCNPFGCLTTDQRSFLAAVLLCFIADLQVKGNAGRV